MAGQAPHILYTKALIHKGHSYLFWYSEPDCSTPDEFIRAGIQPGDIEIHNDSESFNFLFNIFKNAEHPINCGHMPPDFIPLNPSSIQHCTGFYATVIASEHASYSKISAGVSADALSRSVDDRVSAAVLCLPNLAISYDILNKGTMKVYAEKHAVSWYNYINDPDSLDQKALQGSLYVITGSDKMTTWGAAVIGRVASSLNHSLTCATACIGGLNGTDPHAWTTSSGFDTCLYPFSHIAYPYPKHLENQCIFACGDTISVSEVLLKSC
ncbi:uncharacterized protein BT62DRAFT_891933 [Guyanagaster necrorhizus]|uniref:Uncharacterized protein n=1 Tax=Guyanagaster necrorhizus TaxID=856835 RepID=A0A9P7VUT4_9AGAR|nr:uncharacterized protein BT62DRAFT_891933 [Guyanagaster necrorhizus MCA 3950]KAG7447886.1 hypothetical protein BT62DRAFT_891933 [Guyanagaster necrorhizus MCA 3950]